MEASPGLAHPAAEEQAARLDDLDLELIRLLREDGRASNRDLARALGTSEGTVRSRIRRLSDANIMRVVAIADFEAAGNEFFVTVLVRVEGRPVKEVARDMARHPATISVGIVAGRFDIVASCLARDKDHLVRLIADDLGTIPGVQTIETAVALDVVQSTWKWALAL
jgi:DNA-binding Lrp family transcriptional regulator